MLRQTWLVARREYLGYVTAWGFWLGLILTPIGILAGSLLPAMIESSQPVRYYAVVDSETDLSDAVSQQLESWRAGLALSLLQQHIASDAPEEQRKAIDAFEDARARGETPEQALKAANAPPEVIAPDRKYHEVRPPSMRLAELERIMRSEGTVSGPEGTRQLFAALIVHRDQVGVIESVDYLSRDVVTNDLKLVTEGALKRLSRADLLSQHGLTDLDLRQTEARAPPVVNRKVGDTATGGVVKREVTLTDRAPYLAASLAAMVLWLLIFSVVNFLLTSTIEERSNKIFDSLLTCVRLTDLLAGKLLGVLMLAITLVGAWAVMALWAALQFGDAMGPAAAEFLAAALKPQLILPMVAGFLAGYLMYGAVFLALGSLCDTIQEAQTLMSPLVILLMTPLVLVIVAVNDPQSPLLQALSWAPVFTPFLMILRAPLEPPIWETLGHLLVMLTSTAVVLLLAARIYRAGAVHGAGLNEARSWFIGLLPFTGKSKGSD